MPMNMKEMLDQAFEAGRDAERAMSEIAKSFTMHTAAPIATMTAIAKVADNGARKRLGRAAKAHVKATEGDPGFEKASKAPAIARGVKAAPKTREKGVKKAILELIAAEAEGIKTADIISKLGFKASSVNATLMGLKKNGLATQANKLWFGGSSSHVMDGDGSDTETHADF